MNRVLVLVTLTILASVRTASADPPTCLRWENDLTDCEALGMPEGCSVEGVQNELINHQRYATTALKNCKQYIKHRKPVNYTAGMTIQACTFGSDNTCQQMWESPFDPPEDGAHAYCMYDANRDGSIDYNDFSYTGLSIIYYLQTTPDPHCFCTAKGPYDGISWNVEDESPFAIELAWLRRSFPKGLKTAVLKANYEAHGNAYRTDAIYKKTTGLPFDPEPNLQKMDIYEPNAAEIDHIIPRVDSKGCLCGEVTPNNAAVISRELNASMSNTSPKYDLNRARMYEQYVMCPDRSAGRYQRLQFRGAFTIPVEHMQADESVMDIDQ